MLQKLVLSKSQSIDSDCQSFLANVEKNKQKKPNNIYDLVNIKNQANLILQNIENQITQCERLKQGSTNKLSQTKNTSIIQYKKAQTATSSVRNQARPFSAAVNAAIYKKPILQNDKPQQKEEQQIERLTSAPGTRKTLNLNDLCDQNIIMNNFRLEAILGSGSFAMVRLGVDKQSKEKYAIKIYEKLKLNDTQKMNNVKREISILKRVEHSNIIKLCWAIEDKKSINLVMEYISSQSLASYIKSKPSKSLPANESLSLFYQIAMAVKYLHDKNIAHRDIKLDNVLMLKTNVVKLIDFGFAICMPESQKTTIFCGTPHYMSPEIIAKIPHHPSSSDIWSLGILLSKMLTGDYPFKGTNDKDLYRSIQCSKWKMIQDKKLDPNIMRVITGCLEKDPQQRWDINQIISDPIFHSAITLQKQTITKL